MKVGDNQCSLNGMMGWPLPSRPKRTTHKSGRMSSSVDSVRSSRCGCRRFLYRYERFEESEDIGFGDVWSKVFSTDKLARFRCSPINTRSGSVMGWRFIVGKSAPSATVSLVLIELHELYRDRSRWLRSTRSVLYTLKMMCGGRNGI